VTLEFAEWSTGDPEDARTVRHKLILTNLITEISKDRCRASCRYYGTVFGCSALRPYEVRWAGRYHDEFERVGGTWRIITRREATDYPAGNRPSEDALE
jgi:hypothetical protein